jgi:hypothetical protein
MAVNGRQKIIKKYRSVFTPPVLFFDKSVIMPVRCEHPGSGHMIKQVERPMTARQRKCENTVIN